MFFVTALYLHPFEILPNSFYINFLHVCWLFVFTRSHNSNILPVLSIVAIFIEFVQLSRLLVCCVQWYCLPFLLFIVIGYLVGFSHNGADVFQLFTYIPSWLPVWFGWCELHGRLRCHVINDELCYLLCCFLYCSTSFNYDWVWFLYLWMWLKIHFIHIKGLQPKRWYVFVRFCGTC